jgi:hypothetical protein
MHKSMYRAFCGFGQAKFTDSGSILGLSQFTQLPKLPLQMILDLKKGQNGLKNNHLYVNLNL